MAQQLRALTSLPESLGLVSSTHRAVHNHDSSPMWFDIFFWPLKTAKGAIGTLETLKTYKNKGF